MERTKNASRNIIFGFILKTITLLAPFLLRTLLINYLGVEYIGLGSLFTSILNILNLAELGISSAIVFSMYGAIATNDDLLICQLMNLYKKIYRIIGVIVLGLGLIISPFLKFLISGETPNNVNIYFLYFIYLSNTCLTYFLFAYKTCLFNAHQRNDIISKVGTIVSLLTYFIQGLFLVLFRNYYIYVIVLPVTTILNNVILSIVCSKMYPQYYPNGKLPRAYSNEIKKKVTSLFLYKIGNIVLNSVDTIVISAVLGLTVLGKYNNYYYIITAIFGFFEVYYASLIPGIGNSIKLETKEKNLQDFNRLLIMQGWLVSFCAICLLCLYQPFMRLWVGEMLMFPFAIVICFSILFFVWKMMDVVNMFKNAAGLWEYDKWRSVIAAGFNLLLNLILVNTIGIYGIVISTIASIIIIIFPWSTFVLFKHYFNDGDYKKLFVKYVLRIFIFLIIAAIVAFITCSVCFLVPDTNIFYFALKSGLCVILSNVLLLSFYIFFGDFNSTIRWLISKMKGLVRR